jgi:hypothetical protein
VFPLEEIPTSTQTQAAPGDVTSPVPGDVPHEDMVPPTPPPPIGTEESSMVKEEGGRQEDGEEHGSLTNRLTDKPTGDEEQRGQGDDNSARR